MKPQPFVPVNFEVKETIETAEFVIKKLTVDDVEPDYQAVMSSIDIIKKTRGGTSWPFAEMTLEEDKIDLCWHQTEFDYRCSFAYTILNLERDKCLGCIYIYPPNKPWLEYPENTDAVVNWWVTQEAYDNGLYSKIFKFLRNWIAKDWPFHQVYYSNIEIPE